VGVNPQPGECHMDQRQIEKERIRLTREIAMLEQQLSAAVKGKEEKLEENKHIREEIAKLEEENKTLEEETHRLDEEIGALDEEFKAAQIDSGRLRREIKVNTERSESEQKNSASLRAEIAKFEKELSNLQREIKTEIDDRRSLESRLRKANAHIDSMKTHWMANVVTKGLEKQDWFQRQEEPDISFLSDEEEVTEVAKTVGTEPEAVQEAAAEKTEEEDGLDFSVD
jgi:chromosome segregation ATPase